MKKLMAAFLTAALSASIAMPASAYPLIIEEYCENKILFSDILSGPEKKKLTFITAIRDKPDYDYDAEWTGFHSEDYIFDTEERDAIVYVMAPGSTATVEVVVAGGVQGSVEIDGMYSSSDYMSLVPGETAHLEEMFGDEFWHGTVSMINFKDKKNNLICVMDGKDASVTRTETNPQQNYAGFVDVADDAYYAIPVHWAMEHQIVSGTSSTTFSPNVTCTKGQILTFLWRSNGCPEPSVESPFRSLDTTEFYAKAVIWAYEKGIISDKNFDADSPCTRSDAVSYLWKMQEKPTASAASFTDVSSNAEYAEAVNWAVQAGITSGTGANKFSPDESCTRGQIVTFMYKYFAQLK